MNIVLIDFMSLDGVVQSPGGPDEDTEGGFAHGGWSNPHFDPPTMGAAIDSVRRRTDGLLFGRRTWQTMAAAWPGRAGDPFADWMNSVPKHVASRSLTADDLTWSNSRLLTGDAVEAVAKMRESDAGALQIWGSASFARQLVEADLVDEFVMLIEPVLLGGGKRVFPEDGLARPLELVDTAIAATGVVLCTYRRARDASA